MTTLLNELGYTFRNPLLLEQALTHKSFHYENTPSSAGHNERLEFLGDAVLDLVLSEYLFVEKPELPEGELSKIRASWVNEKSLAQLAADLGLPNVLKLGKGELSSGGALKPRLLACGFEALVGAIYLDSGFEKARELVLKFFSELLSSADADEHYVDDYKTKLQEWTQKMHRQTPTYVLVKEEGPDHAKIFFVEVHLGDQVLAEGQGSSKKQAEQEAASKAMGVIQ